MKLDKRLQKGFTLIEALISALVFATGIVAVVSLQQNFFSYSSNANARALAIDHAQSKLDELRSMDFAAIDEGAGEQTVIGPVTFTRNWNYTSYYYDNNGVLTACPDDFCDLDADGESDADQKAIVVTVSWTNSDGTVDTVTLNYVINRNADETAGSVIGFEPGGSGEKPVVIYTPSVDPGVVAIGVGGAKKRETLIPTSDGENKVKFTAYTYDNNGQLLRQEDFLTVSCNCAFTTLDPAEEPPVSPAHAVWDSLTNSFKDKPGEIVTSKDVGCETNGNNANCKANPEPLCNSCCKNHHDAASTVVDSNGDPKFCDPSATPPILEGCYDPFRGQEGHTTGKHHHYNKEGNQVTAGQYLESCRMKRVDGRWRVYQDWHRVDLNAFPVGVLLSPTDEATYAGYVQSIVDSILDDAGVTQFFGQPITSLSSPPAKPPLIHRTDANPVTLALNQFESLSGRAVYVDFLSSSLLTETRNKKANNAEYLIDIPFYEVEVTNRAPRCAPAEIAYGGWCPPGSGEVDVGAGDIGSNQGNGLAPGQIKGIASTGGSSKNVDFSFRRSNSALMGLSVPVDLDIAADNNDKLRDTASVAVVVADVLSTTHPLTVTLIGALPTSGTMSVTLDTGTISCTGSGDTYDCTVPNDIGGAISFEGYAGTDICVGSGSYAASSSSQAVDLAITCTASGADHLITVTLNPSGGQPIGGTLTASTASNCAAIDNLTYTCIEPNDTIDTVATGTLDYTDNYCSGTGSYTVQVSDYSVTLDVTCITTQVPTVCVNPPSGHTLLSGGTLNDCDETGACGSGNKGKLFSCHVQNGPNTFTFNGTKVSGNTTSDCIGTFATDVTSDATLNMTCN